MPELVQRLDTLLPCRTTGHQQHPHLLHRSVAPLRGHRRFTRQRCPGCRHRVGRVRLADLAALLPVGSIHLDGFDPDVGEEPRQAHSPRPGALHPNPVDRTEPGQPTHQVLEPGRVRGKRFDPQHATVVIDRRGHMDISVGIHPTSHRYH